MKLWITLVGLAAACSAKEDGLFGGGRSTLWCGHKDDDGGSTDMPSMAPTQCLDLDQTCDGTSPCCDGLECDSNACCLPLGSACTESDDCCGRFSSGHLCSPTGEICITCFPGDAMVDVENQGPMRMDMLRRGDRVLTDQGYSGIYAFGHQLPELQAEYVRLTTASNHVLELSKTHQVFVGKKQVPKHAVNVDVGDDLVIMPSMMLSPVTSKTIVHKQGVYNALNHRGSIVVNNVLASTFCSAPRIVTQWWGSQYILFTAHAVKQYLLLPSRYMCLASDRWCSHNLDGKLETIVAVDRMLEALTMPIVDSDGTQHTGFKSAWSAFLFVMLAACIFPIWVVDQVGIIGVTTLLVTMLYYVVSFPKKSVVHTN